MVNDRQRFGARGEARAERFLRRLGWQILEHNWWCKEGEADLIAWDPEEDALVVVEVKTRSGSGYGSPLDAITYAKVRRLRRIAAIYARGARRSARRLRVDAVGILWLPGEAEPELVHARGIEES